MSTKKPSATESLLASDSVVSRFIVAPVLFISFLLSLFLIDRKTYGSVFSYNTNKDKYYHSHQRKLAKHEIEDAFHLRNKVIAAMLMIGGISLAVVGWGGSKMWHAMLSQT